MMTSSQLDLLEEWTLFSLDEVDRILNARKLYRASGYKQPSQPDVWHYLVCGEFGMTKFLKTGLFFGDDPLDRDRTHYKRLVAAFRVPTKLARLHDTVTRTLLNIDADITRIEQKRDDPCFDGYTECFHGNEDQVLTIFNAAHCRLLEWSARYPEVQATAELALLRLIIQYQSVIQKGVDQHYQHKINQVRQDFYASVYYYKSIPIDWVDLIMELYDLPSPLPTPFYIRARKGHKPPNPQEVSLLMSFMSDLNQNSTSCDPYRQVYALMKSKKQYREHKGLITQHIELLAGQARSGSAIGLNNSATETTLATEGLADVRIPPPPPPKATSLGNRLRKRIDR